MWFKKKKEIESEPAVEINGTIGDAATIKNMQVSRKQLDIKSPPNCFVLYRKDNSNYQRYFGDKIYDTPDTLKTYYLTFVDKSEHKFKGAMTLQYEDEDFNNVKKNLSVPYSLSYKITYPLDLISQINLNRDNIPVQTINDLVKDRFEIVARSLFYRHLTGGIQKVRGELLRIIEAIEAEIDYEESLHNIGVSITNLNIQDVIEDPSVVRKENDLKIKEQVFKGSIEK